MQRVAFDFVSSGFSRILKIENKHTHTHRQEQQEKEKPNGMGRGKLTIFFSSFSKKEIKKIKFQMNFQEMRVCGIFECLCISFRRFILPTWSLLLLLLLLLLRQTRFVVEIVNGAKRESH